MSMLKNILLVALGGGVGTVCRYLLSEINTASFPWGTIVANIIGSLLIGFFVGLVGKGILSPEMKLLLVTGFCGGFTTFSTFANESFGMMKAGDVMLSALYVGASIVIGIYDIWLEKKYKKRTQYNPVIEKLLDDANFEHWKYVNEQERIRTSQ